MSKSTSSGLIPDKVPGPSLRVVINGAHAKSGGGVTYLRKILPELVKQPGLELHLFLHRDQLELFYPVCDGVRISLFEHNSGFWPTLWWEQFSLPVLTRAMRADVVFSPANYGPLFVRNHVIMLRNATSVIRLTARLRSVRYWLVLSVATFASLVFARRAIAVSGYAARILTFGMGRLFRRKLDVVYHGASKPLRVRDNNRSPGKSLLAVSDIYVQKNYHSLIRAFARLHEHDPDLTLAIAGREIDTHYAGSVKELAQRLDVGDAVQFMGHLDSDAVADLYQKCNVFVFPSTIETFGNPLLEAMSVGVPIACSNSAAMPEVIGDAGLTFDPYDIGDIACKIEELLNNPELREDLGKKAVRRAEQFSLSKTAEFTAIVLRNAAKPERTRLREV
ncbi:MAG: glycosyltransferase family 1 protein [Pseudomonadota bacterium]|nr:glycosyltransferase family 1 protein [Pseudomonadota bacterium]